MLTLIVFIIFAKSSKESNIWIDWGKNSYFKDHSALFKPKDVKLIPYYYVGDDDKPLISKNTLNPNITPFFPPTASSNLSYISFSEIIHLRIKVCKKKIGFTWVHT